MTDKEYNTKEAEITKIYKEDIRQLNAQYAKDLRKFNIGDIITNNAVTIIVESFTYHRFGSMPQPVYVGKELTKKLELRKDGSSAMIYGDDRVKHIK